MTPPPRRLTVAAARACAPWYRVHQMAAKLQRELGRLEAPPAEAAGPFAALVLAVNEAVDEAGACVAIAEREATRLP